MEKVVVRHAYKRKRQRLQVSFADVVSRTKQSFTDQCNINSIVSRFQRTGVLDHVKNYGGSYGFASGVDFKEAMDIVARSKSMFASLPSEIRSRFGNDPAAFLDFVSDDANREEMVELGLAEPVEAPRDAPLETVPAAEPEDSTTAATSTSTAPGEGTAQSST